MVDSIEHAVEKKDHSGMLSSIRRFMDCAHVHFANEERIAQEVDYCFEQHRLMHQHLLKALQSSWNELQGCNGVWHGYAMDHYPQFLREWLVGHITGEDMRMKQMLQSYPYDFKPG